MIGTTAIIASRTEFASHPLTISAALVRPSCDKHRMCAAARYCRLGWVKRARDHFASRNTVSMNSRSTSASSFRQRVDVRFGVAKIRDVTDALTGHDIQDQVAQPAHG